MEVFQKVLSTVESDMYRDFMSCSNCHAQGSWEFCTHSRYHPQHKLHECPEDQICFV